MAHVVVVGGGFAGVEAAIQLRSKGFSVKLVSDRPFLFVYPISIWIPVEGITFEDACQPLAPLAEKHGFELVIASVSGVEPARRVVHTAGGEAIPYDELVVALGAGKTRPKGIEHTLSPCGEPTGSVAIRERYQALLQRAKAGETNLSLVFGFGGNPKDKSAVRGGPVFEILFNILHDLEKKGLRDAFELTFVAPMPEPGKKMGPGAPEKIRRQLEGRGVRWQVGTGIASFDAEAVTLVDGQRIAADLVVFVPANAGHPVAASMGLPLSDAGFIHVDPQCRVEGVPHVWAAGDAARLQGPAWIAKQGHVAEAMAKVIAHNLHVLLQETGGELHSYQDHLSILCVMDTGDGATVVYRDENRSMMVPMPVVGHWMKRAWGTYWKKSKEGAIPRIPGM